MDFLQVQLNIEPFVQPSEHSNTLLTSERVPVKSASTPLLILLSGVLLSDEELPEMLSLLVLSEVLISDALSVGLDVLVLLSDEELPEMLSLLVLSEVLISDALSVELDVLVLLSGEAVPTLSVQPHSIVIIAITNAPFFISLFIISRSFRYSL